MEFKIYLEFVIWNLFVICDLKFICDLEFGICDLEFVIYEKSWYARLGSNQRLSAPEADALSTELRAHI